MYAFQTLHKRAQASGVVTSAAVAAGDLASRQTFGFSIHFVSDKMFPPVRRVALVSSVPNDWSINFSYFIFQ